MAAGLPMESVASHVELGHRQELELVIVHHLNREAKIVWNSDLLLSRGHATHKSVQVGIR